MGKKEVLNNSIKSILITSLFLVLLSSCKTKSNYTSSWNGNPQGLIENKNSHVEDMHYDTDAKMLYGLINDNENLYILLEVSDKTVQKKILISGLTFWMDTIGKKKEQLGITFPLEGSMGNRTGKMNKEEMMKQMQRGSFNGDFDYQNLNETFSNGLNKMEIIGFNNEKEPLMVFNQNPKGISVSIKFDNMGTLHYKANIPLKLIFKQPDLFLNDATKLFSFGFETGAIDTPSMNGGGRQGGGMGHGGSMSGKGGRGGGGGGGRAGSGMPAMQELSKPSKFWVKSARLVNS